MDQEFRTVSFCCITDFSLEHAFYDANHRKDQFTIERKYLTEELSKLKTHNAAEGRIIKKNITFTSEREGRKKAREGDEKT